MRAALRTTFALTWLACPVRGVIHTKHQASFALSHGREMLAAPRFARNASRCNFL